jgi:hypothetical protein
MDINSHILVKLYLSAYSSNSTKYLSSIHQYKPSSSTEALSSLPDVIESNCLNWENALQSKLNNQNSRWFPSKLKCSDVFVYGKTTKLILTTGKVFIYTVSFCGFLIFTIFGIIY